MPVNIIIGLISLLVALVLYTTGVVRAFRRKGFSAGTLAELGIGVVFDVTATVMMGMQIGGLDLRPGTPLLHTVLALIAMAGMIVGTLLGAWALFSKREALQRLVSRAIVAPWALWIAVFVWGMVTRGAARMGA